MQASMILDWLIPALIGVVSAGVSVRWLTAAGGRWRVGLRGSPTTGDAVFLFDGDDLIDATAAARFCLQADGDIGGWAQLRETLADRYPGFPERPADLRGKGQLIIAAVTPGTPAEAVCEWIDGIVRVQLRDKSGITGAVLPPGPETETMRLAMRAAPYPIWRTDSDGGVIWGNDAYAALRHKVAGPDACGTAPLFPNVQDNLPTGKRTRQSIPIAQSDHRLWFDVSVVPHEAGYMCYAVDINAVVDAEVAQRNFVQTLTKTFAQLSIGLAIFDRNRQLQLFNPALIYLTALPADFLSGRPTLLSFFDRLRDQRLIPEPKNYSSWRAQMADLVAAAADGRYQETWSLPSGSVYSVCGRPHPDGAVAFLIEDITAEITLTRRFRSDIELGQSVLDQLEEAVAVFAADGTLTHTNSAYRRLWDVDPDRSFARTTVLDATRAWQGRCRATPFWGELRDFVMSRENRAEWWAQVQSRQGGAMDCGVFPVHGGATMVSFRSARTKAPLVPHPPAIAAPTR